MDGSTQKPKNMSIGMITTSIPINLTGDSKIGMTGSPEKSDLKQDPSLLATMLL